MAKRKNAEKQLKKSIKKNPALLIALVIASLLVVVLATSRSGTGGISDSAPDRDDYPVGVEPFEPVAELSGDEIAAVHVIDVDQGDSILVLTREKAVLIDAGERDQGQVVCDYLKANGVEKLDLVITTHPHSDHIGGMADVLNTFPTDEIVMPPLADDIVPTTAVFKRLLDAIEDNGITATPAQPGLSFDLGGASLQLLSPLGDYNDLNNCSIVSRLDCGEVSFLFMGDAEKEVEEDLIDEGMPLKADVLKCGHHGSNTSSSDDFLDAVSPRMAAISCGVDNDYGHPHKEVLQRLEERNITAYRTDLCGSIVFTTDGKEISVHTQYDDKEAQE